MSNHCPEDTKERSFMDRQNNRQKNRIATRQPSSLMQVARRRRQLHSFFFRMGPVTLSICSVLLISLMAILYLSQLGQAVTTNQQIQDLRAQQAVLQRQNHDLVNTVAQERSPAYIAERARAMGLAPANQQNAHVVVIPRIKAQPNGDQPNEP